MTAGSIAVPTIIPLRAPIPGLTKNEVDTNTKIELHSDTRDVKIFYTINGTKPEPFSVHGLAAKSTIQYMEPFWLPAGKRTVKALAVSDDGRESNVVTKQFDVEDTNPHPPPKTEDGLEFINDIPPTNELARHEVKKFQHKLMTSKEAFAELERTRAEDLSRGTVTPGSDRRRPPSSSRYLAEKYGTSPGRSSRSAYDLRSGSPTRDDPYRSRRLVPPDGASQTMRLQRETDFLKCAYCFASRPADPYARYCNECGNPVPSLPQSKLNPPMAAQMGTCSQCKSVVPLNTPHCLICEAPHMPHSPHQSPLLVGDKVVCVVCGTGNPSNLTACVTCLAKLPTGMLNRPLIPDGSLAPPTMGGEGGDQPLQCSKCGRINNVQARFCDWCGSRPSHSVTNLVCSRCHGNNSPYAKFCAVCGAVMDAPPRIDMRNTSGFGYTNGTTHHQQPGQQPARWVRSGGSFPGGPPVAKCDMSTQTVGLFYPSQKGISRKIADEDDKMALEREMRDRKPVVTAVSPGRGYWRKQMEHICLHLKVYAQNNAEFRSLIGEPRMGRITSATVHEDGFELSVTATFALRGPQDAGYGSGGGGGRPLDSDYLSSYTTAAKASIKSYASQDSLASVSTTRESTARSAAPSTASRKSLKKKTKKVVRKKPIKDEEKITLENKKLLKELGKEAEGRPGEVQLLIEQGSDPNCVNKDGYPALHVATMNKHIDVIPVLVQEGADINRKGPSKGNTALHEAVVLGNEFSAVIDALLNCGASPQRKNDRGETAYDLAVKGGHDSIVRKLSSSLGQTALGKMAKAGSAGGGAVEIF